MADKGGGLKSPLCLHLWTSGDSSSVPGVNEQSFSKGSLNSQRVCREQSLWEGYSLFPSSCPFTPWKGESKLLDFLIIGKEWVAKFWWIYASFSGHLFFTA